MNPNEIEKLLQDFEKMVDKEPVKTTLDLPELPKVETDMYCKCSNPKIKEVWMISSKYNFCEKCRKEKK